MRLRQTTSSPGHALTSWTDGDGVPLGTVYSIGQDHDGYLWIATDAGLFRFDGVRFTPWDSIGETPLPRTPVSALWLARDGQHLGGASGWCGIYAGTASSGGPAARHVGSVIDTRGGSPRHGVGGERRRPL